MLSKEGEEVITQASDSDKMTESGSKDPVGFKNPQTTELKLRVSVPQPKPCPRAA